MNKRRQKLLELMNRNLKISTLINYKFKISFNFHKKSWYYF